jgi:hypothetical protein
MQAKASGPIYLQHHAVLVIRAAAGPEILHWSYNRRTFLRADGMLAPVVHCEPVPGFLDRLTWLGVTPGGSSAASLISMAGHSFRIPADYQPKASSANADIRIAAMAPDFAPLADPPEKGGGVLRLAYVTFDPYRYALAREKESGTDIAPEHGLAKRIFRTGSLTITRYTSGESNGHPDVTIECQLRGCDFLFVRDGVGYAFEADATLLPRWRELRDRLEALFDSWRVEP